MQKQSRMESDRGTSTFSEIIDEGQEVAEEYARIGTDIGDGQNDQNIVFNFELWIQGDQGLAAITVII